MCFKAEVVSDQPRTGAVVISIDAKSSLVGVIHGIKSPGQPFLETVAQEDCIHNAAEPHMILVEVKYIFSIDEDIWNALEKHTWLMPDWHTWHTNIDGIQDTKRQVCQKAIKRLDASLHGKPTKPNVDCVSYFHAARRLRKSTKTETYFTDQEWEVMVKTQKNFYPNQWYLLTEWTGVIIIFSLSRCMY
jgi:hypothetical protein